MSVDEPIFQPFPPEVTFHNYEAFQTYEATLYLRNNDNVRLVLSLGSMGVRRKAVSRTATSCGRRCPRVQERIGSSPAPELLKRRSYLPASTPGYLPASSQTTIKSTNANFLVAYLLTAMQCWMVVA